MADVTLISVRKVFDRGIVAVDDVSLTVADGEFVVLVGPSGCGKSTTLRMIAGLETLSGGEIRIGGRVVNTVAPKDRDIAMVFQNYALYPHMSIRKNLGFALKMRRTPKADIARRVDAVARLLGIHELLDRRPGHLSGGQQQRVALGRAIIREPAAFLFDEPLSNLDATLRHSMRAEIKSLQRRVGTTTIHVTHDQEEAMTLGDRVVVMCDGRIQQAGPPLSVYERPVNRFVASFIGAPAMNFIEGAIATDDGALVFVERRDGARWAIPSRWRSTLERRATPGIVLGVRPPALSTTAADDASAILRGEVELREVLGDVIDVHVRLAGGTAVIARVPARSGVPVDGAIALRCGPEAVA
ncbi:MAG: sn-glycerol-3-phosphate ABC transporter ATP-binding protein UgpC, partial [Phycisphaerales bacterium]|nr:sn-glycerol-3-phosphate ABC transporter ATP-binding protein UgpC [Phycisphaerales bacterium]